MTTCLRLKFMETLKSVLSGRWSVMVTWLSEWNRVEALAVGALSLRQRHALTFLGADSPHCPGSVDLMAVCRPPRRHECL